MFQIDTNRINARGALESMNRLEQWVASDVIVIDMSENAFREALAGGNAQRTKKTQNHIISEMLANTENEQRRLRQIEEILFPNGAKNDNQKNDVAITFTAWKYSRILVTEDGDILNKRVELKQQIDLDVMTDREVVKLVEHQIKQRDALARRLHEERNQPLPEWVSKDN